MKPKTIKIDDDVREVLRTIACSGCFAAITRQLDRPLYEKVDKVLKALGGKWSKGKGHKFPSDAANIIAQVVDARDVVDVKKTHGQFFTPPELAADIVRGIKGLGKGVRVLEPSAGEGALAIAVAATGATVTCVEMDPRLAGILESYGYRVIEDDFLSQPWPVVENEFYDVVLMNPPFAGDQDIEHVRHALQFLKPRGRLVAIMSPGFTMGGRKARSEFRDLVMKLGGWDELPEGSFKESGTSVRTVLVTLTKPAD